MSLEYITFKVIIMGHQGTGKTALAFNFVKGQFKHNYQATIGVEFCTKTIKVGDTNVQMQIWDTAGQQTYHSITKSFYKGACAVFMVYAIDDHSSFKRLREILKQVKQYASQEACFIFVGTKLDQENNRKVSLKEVTELCKEANACYKAETSAKKGIFVEELFENVANILLSKWKSSSKFRELIPKKEEIG